MPMNPGKPLLQRPQALGFLLPIVAFLLVVVVASSGSSDNSTDNSGASGGLPVVTDSPSDTSLPTDSPTATDPGSGTDPAAAAQAGDCVQNNGTDTSPDLAIVTCTPGTYLVEKRLDNTVLTDNCPSDATKTYTSYSDNFVLCLKND